MKKDSKLIKAALHGLAQAKVISARASSGHSAKVENSCNGKQMSCGGKK